MRLLVYTGKTPLYNASVKGDILLHMTVYMWGLRGRYFLTIYIYYRYIHKKIYIHDMTSKKQVFQPPPRWVDPTRWTKDQGSARPPADLR